MSRFLRYANLCLLVLFPIAWFAPLLRAGLLPLFGLSEISVISGLQSLWGEDVVLALVVTVLAIFAPYLKTIGLALVHFRLGSPRLVPALNILGKLAMILAVLEARCGIPFAGLDVYLNVAGDMKISEPAADLAVAAALLSAREDVALPPDTVVFGELSLSGALRPVSQTENRLKESGKLGFTAAIVPKRSKSGAGAGLNLKPMGDLAQMVGEIFGAG